MKKKLYAKLCNLNSKLLVSNEEGATMVEYGLLVALIAVACILAITGVGTALQGLFSTISSDVTSAS